MTPLPDSAALLERAQTLRHAGNLEESASVYEQLVSRLAGIMRRGFRRVNITGRSSTPSEFVVQSAGDDLFQRHRPSMCPEGCETFVAQFATRTFEVMLILSTLVGQAAN
jgi:hypothetical protein